MSRFRAMSGGNQVQDDIGADNGKQTDISDWHAIRTFEGDWSGSFARSAAVVSCCGGSFAQDEVSPATSAVRGGHSIRNIWPPHAALSGSVGL